MTLDSVGVKLNMNLIEVTAQFNSSENKTVTIL